MASHALSVYGPPLYFLENTTLGVIFNSSPKRKDSFSYSCISHLPCLLITEFSHYQLSDVKCCRPIAAIFK